jgi:lipoprotein-anchoring transpeptidase ErfK/SrfK
VRHRRLVADHHHHRRLRHRCPPRRNGQGTPPPQMRARQRGLPAHMAGGEGQPGGRGAVISRQYALSNSGSNDPDSIGQAESSGCFRMTNDDIKDLYERVALGTTVIVR